MLEALGPAQDLPQRRPCVVPGLLPGQEAPSGGSAPPRGTAGRVAQLCPAPRGASPCPSAPSPTQWQPQERGALVTRAEPPRQRLRVRGLRSHGKGCFNVLSKCAKARDSQSPAVSQAVSLPGGASPARCPHLNRGKRERGRSGTRRGEAPVPCPQISRLGHTWLGPSLEHPLPCPSRVLPGSTWEQERRGTGTFPALCRAQGRGCQAGRAALAFPVGTSSPFPSRSALQPPRLLLMAVPPLALPTGARRRMRCWDKGEGHSESACSPRSSFPSPSAVVLSTENPPAARAGQEGGGLSLEQVSPWRFLRVLDFQRTRNPREEALLCPLHRERFLGGLVEPKHPRTLFHRSQGGGERARGNFLTAGPRPGRMQLHPWNRAERGDLGAFPRYFFGEAT